MRPGAVGYDVLVLTSWRLPENISRPERMIAQKKAARQTTATDDIALPSGSTLSLSLFAEFA
jgi:hypothetical protein